MEIGGITGDIFRRDSSLTHVLVFGDRLQFLWGTKTSTLGNIFDKVWNWRLIIPELAGIWKMC